MKSPLIAKSEVLTEAAIYRLDELLELLDISTTENSNKFWGQCPIHDGNNGRSFNIYKDTGSWRCFTNNCHLKYGANLIGLIGAILGRKKAGYGVEDFKKARFSESVNFLAKFLKQDLNSLKVDEADLEKKRFGRQFGNNRSVSDIFGQSRGWIRSKLAIPAEYYVKQGYSPEILNEYDIGLCLDKDKLFYNRIVVPIYNKDGLYIGASSRSIFDECDKCGLHHSCSDNCPKWYIENYVKWRHSPDLRKTENLFNIRKCLHSPVIIIVEGIMDCLRLVDAGFPNSVAIFGADLSYAQLQLLAQTQATKLLTIMDNDKGGEQARKSIDDKCQNLYQIEHLVPPKKDVGKMSKTEVNKWLINFITL